MVVLVVFLKMLLDRSLLVLSLMQDMLVSTMLELERLLSIQVLTLMMLCCSR